ncbi:hypothetical protein Ancab_029367 [Ancistrocladus abbreviatus]
MLLRIRPVSPQIYALLPTPLPLFANNLCVSLHFHLHSPFSLPKHSAPKPRDFHRHYASKAATPPLSDAAKFIRTVLFVPPGVELEQVSEDMILPGSNIVLGPYAGHAQIKEVEFVKSSNRPKDCPRDNRPEFAVLGRSNVGKSSLINALVRKKEVALTSKKPGKTQLINHFLVNKSWYLVDLPGYGKLPFCSIGCNGTEMCSLRTSFNKDATSEDLILTVFFGDVETNGLVMVLLSEWCNSKRLV